MTKRDARLRLPREPYPGLRPFLDFEAALLFGRERQVREIIERLAATQFVAVLGGSGSGKSSLIHAGVTPELRSFGIPGAGDLWLPMVCTPGTNVRAEDRAARRHTPVTRLARRFAGLLKSRGSDEADAARLDDIAAAFRQEAGFARLLDAYAAELDVPPGPDPQEARVLFVIDQFEEIFHPTNKDASNRFEPDAQALVERVLDHFFAPHPRCYVVLTMRSEHLNDCAAFLELPDAINKSSFLVRRLGPDEIRQAIVGPAQRFLRLVARSQPDAKLPEQVQFEPAVIERLLRDVSAITHDPDHLPLLQHLLARLWNAALEREEVDVPVPAFITEIDLVRAVVGGAGPAVPTGDEQPLPPAVNTLRESVNNWPEKLYQWHEPAERAMLDALFRRLGFKDPNTGLFSQQRVDVDEAAALLGPGRTRDDLKALIAEGFLGNVDYLFWDDEDPSRVTLKVSHESFIRGWQRFRALVATESERFDQFLGLLRKCALWAEGGRLEDDLLEQREMRRLRDGEFERRLADPAQRASWVKLLSLDRDAVRLARHVEALDDFVARSDRRVREQIRREQRARRVRAGLFIGFTLIGLVPTFLFTVLIQTPTMRRAELLFDAGNRANATVLLQTYGQVGATNAALESLLRAAERVDDARTGQGAPLGAVSGALTAQLGWIPPVRRQGEFLGGVMAQSEPLVNGKLRQLLTQALWRAPEPAPGALLEPPLVIEQALCGRAVLSADGGIVEALKGRLFVAVPRGGRGAAGEGADARGGDAAAAPTGGDAAAMPSGGDAADVRGGAGARANPIRRALFIPERAADDRALQLVAATYHLGERQCVLGPSVLSLPHALAPHAVFDAGLRYLLYTAEVDGAEAPALIVQEIDWYWGRFGQIRALHRQTLTALTDRRAVARVREASGPNRAGPVATWRLDGGRGLAVAGANWRVVSAQARPMGTALEAGAAGEGAVSRSLPPAESGSACARIAGATPPTPGFRITAWQLGTHCLVTERGRLGEDIAIDAAGVAPAEGGEPPREEIRVALYNTPTEATLDRLDETRPAPVASIAPFARVAEPEDTPLQWSYGVAGTVQGWLMLTRTTASGGTAVIGAPLATCALWQLGRQLQAQNPPPAATPASGPAPAAHRPPSACD